MTGLNAQASAPLDARGTAAPPFRGNDQRSKGQGIRRLDLGSFEQHKCIWGF